MKVAVTIGDPYGIGPEIIALAQQKGLLLEDELIFYGPQSVIEHYKISGKVKDPTSFYFDKVKLGTVDKEAGKASLDSLQAAIKDAKENKIEAVVTGPINKESIHLAGESENGHTGILKRETGANDVVMSFFSDKLNVFLATTHIALSKVSEKVTQERFKKVCEIAQQGLIEYGIKNPKIAVCGINPHGGEHGLMGDEEDKVLVPVIEQLQKENVQVSGPYPADTIFIDVLDKKYDGVIAHYHDQGLIPFKMVAFHDGVNVSLGLPIIRTSVDHGTAFDIVGQGVANPGSLIAAVKAAKKFINAKKT